MQNFRTAAHPPNSTKIKM